MITILLIFHLIIASFLVGAILLQRGEGGALGIGGGGAAGGMITARGATNLLTRTTAILVALFFTSSILLAIMFRGGDKPQSIVDDTPPTATQPVSGPTIDSDEEDTEE